MMNFPDQNSADIARLKRFCTFAVDYIGVRATPNNNRHLSSKWMSVLF